jgi:type IV pilus assembly protein PilM
MGIFKKSVVGIEIDTTEIRAVNLEGTSDKPRLISYGRQPLNNGIVKDGNILEPKLLVEAIIKLWETNNIRSRDIVLGINNQDVILRFASIPKVPENKIKDLIRFQSEDYIPIPLNEIELDYSVLGDDNSVEPPQTRVLLVAARKKMLFNYINIMQQARLNVLDIGVSMLSLNRLVPKALSDSPLAVINLSNGIGSIVIGDGKEPGFARTFPYNNAMREAIREYLSSSASTRYLMGETKLATISSFLANEISSSVIYYQNKHSDVSVQNLAITGGISQTKGLIQHLGSLLGINVALFGHLENGEGNNDNAFSAPDFAVCTSLALRGLEV